MLKLALLWVFLLLFDFSFTLEIGPPLDYLIPRDFSHEYPRREINLEAFSPSYSVVLPITNGSSKALVSSVHFSGEFVVTAPPEYGLMVVVQELRLRTHDIYNEENGVTFLKCRDYLRFKSVNQSSQVCGSVVKYSKDGNPSGLLGPRTFITYERQLSIGLHVDRSPVDHNFGWPETVTLELVITAFKECPKSTFVSQVSDWIKRTGGSGLKSCSPSEDRICISSETFCDGVMTCGVKGPLGQIGYDEESCKPFRIPPLSEPPLRVTPPPPVTPPPTKEPTIYIGDNKTYSPPVSGKVISPIHLILIFSTVVLVIFGACTWLAKANEKKFQHTMYRFSTMRRNRHRNHRQPRAVSTDTLATLPRRPSAPADSTSNTLGTPSSSEAVIEVPPGEEPPPYDDLFPTAPPLSVTPTPT